MGQRPHIYFYFSGSLYFWFYLSYVREHAHIRGVMMYKIQNDLYIYILCQWR